MTQICSDNYFVHFILSQSLESLGEGNGNPLQYTCLENPMDGGAWWAAVHGVVKSQARLSDFTFTFHFPALEKEMATHSSVLAWRIPGTFRPHGLYSPWNSPCQNTGVGSLSLLQGIFPTQGSNPGLPQYRWILYRLSHKGSPNMHTNTPQIYD